MTTGLLMPLYAALYPGTNGSAWAPLVAASRAYPNVPILAIADPSDGPGTSQDPNYSSGINLLRSNRIKVLGYVPTNYTATNLSAVEADINTWRSLYTTDGIFFDEANGGTQSFYQQIVSYANSLTVLNPGTQFPYPPLGIVNIWENSFEPSISELASYTSGNRNQFSLVVHSAPFDSSFIQAASKYVSWILLTDSTDYGAFPSYLNQEMSLLSSLNSMSPAVPFPLNLVQDFINLIGRILPPLPRP